jgi:hypothetical protein
MIIFDLLCTNDHGFEGWFDSNEEFERQLTEGQILCPYCKDSHIQRVPSAVAIKRQASPFNQRDKAWKSWRKFCRYVRDNFEDVGHNFAKEALKVHCGLTEERNIRGVTTEVEEDMLKEEGVPFVKIPMPQHLDG